jgi:hypothetical protein
VEPRAAEPEPAPIAEQPAAPEQDALERGLDDPEQREAAITRLMTAYEQAVQNGTKTESARRFVVQHGPALTRAYVEGHADLPSKTRIELINLLVSFDDPVTTPALALAISNYASKGDSVEEAIWACQAARKLRSKELQAALYHAFEALDMSDKDGRRFSQHLEQAMLFNATPEWSAKLRARLKEPILRPDRFDDKAAVRDFNNQRFWQITAAKVLGKLHDGAAARALLFVLCDPDKRDIQQEAERAFAGLGKPAVDLAHDLLAGEDQELSSGAQKWKPELRNAHVFLAAKLLMNLAHPSSEQPVLAAWKKASTPAAKVMLVRVLTRLPRTDENVDAWKRTFASTRADVTLPEGEGALETLAHSSVFFFDPDLAPWLAAQLDRVRGKGARRADVVRALMSSSTELMQEEHVKDLTVLAQKYGGREGTPAFAAASELLERCGKDPTCYVNATVEAGSQTDERASVSVKAATMVAILGTTEHRDQLLQKLPEVKNDTVAVRVAEVLSAMTPSYDEGVASALATRLKGEQSPTVTTAFERALYRISARR